MKHKIQIHISITNPMMNKIMDAVDLGITSVRQRDHIITFNSSEPEKWLTAERKQEFEEMYNKENATDRLAFIVEKITAESI